MIGGAVSVADAEVRVAPRSMHAVGGKLADRWPSSSLTGSRNETNGAVNGFAFIFAGKRENHALVDLDALQEGINEYLIRYID